MHIHLLLVEDNLDLANTVIEYLEITGIVCDHASNGQTGLNLALRQHYDVILLDIMLPRLDGQQLCKQLREQGKQTPILMLTSLDALPDKLASFAMGADDYLVKPFELAELVARIRALSLRRSGQASRLQVADLTMDLSTRKVSRAGQELHLSPTCWTLLECLMRASPEPVGRERLEATVWGDEPPDSNTLKVHMHRLRKAVDKDFSQALIHTISGVGVQLRTPCVKG
ncbi:response regulator transcription factor [Pseudomonas chlororaphis]|uniref:response regulator transcription factor n=1 Tax=Pseudomonas chlororaphis TaxID=587753 RepID=UPI0006A6142C|nr:response regulator transcription factor [Pseudomonas chlororaphis]AZD04358.1 Two-component system regulatory protein [Pseudomonas chlororaphis subsp. chlororaphis]MBM0281443.1 response regulator transcription factor [Pseudomonas chlororaphis]MDO1502813.1 response regulator transcription factor [Pseudomonas chlororaphis]ORM46290.1 DNA-binding response regulator [Pseudomonas chlororaphis subsp. chlororaphis]TWR97532.1 response regulator transcription factor [Pseudomonas chlororaphis subsp. ch